MGQKREEGVFETLQLISFRFSEFFFLSFLPFTCFLVQKKRTEETWVKRTRGRKTLNERAKKKTWKENLYLYTLVFEKERFMGVSRTSNGFLGLLSTSNAFLLNWQMFLKNIFFFVYERERRPVAELNHFFSNDFYLFFLKKKRKTNGTEPFPLTTHFFFLSLSLSPRNSFILLEFTVR